MDKTHELRADGTSTTFLKYINQRTNRVLFNKYEYS